MSPTPYWSSRVMKIPARKSRTRFCAPNASATPAIPAEASSGATSMPSSARISTAAMLTTRNELIDLSNEPMAMVRWARRSADSPRVNARRA